MKKLYSLLTGLAVSSLAVTASAQVTINGTPYVNLTYAFAAINAGTHTGNILVEINADCSEGGGVASLNASGTGSASYTSVTIRPTADNVTVDGSGSSVIYLRGADNVTIDGNNLNSNLSQHDLTITNTSLGGGNTCIRIASFSLTNSANNNTVRNCIIEGVSAAETSFGIKSGGVTDVTQDAESNNQNNTLDSNIIRKCDVGIGIGGNVNAQDNNWRIRANTIGSANPGDEVGGQGISAHNVVSMTIMDNVISGIYGNSTQSIKGINISGNALGTNTIARNSIHAISNEDNSVAAGAVGLYINAGPSVGGFSIYNNEIWDISCYGNQDGFTVDNNACGIALAQGDNFEIWHNTILMDGESDLIAPSAAIFVAGGVAPGSVTLQNNLLVCDNAVLNDTAYAVYNTALAPFADIDYNLYYTDGPNLNYTGGNPIPDLSSWKALTLNDTGSVSALPVLLISGNDISVDANDPSCWFVNGRGIASTNSSYNYDINNNPRSAVIGTPTDIGSREFTPAGGVIPDDAISSGTPANNTTTSYYSASRKIAEISWGPNGTPPTSVSLKYYPSVPPPAWGPGVRINSHLDIVETGGSGFDYTIKMYYTEAENNGLDDAMLRIVRDSTYNGDWTNQGGNNAKDFDGRFVNPSNSLGQFGFFTLGDVPLPLELLSFNGKNMGSYNTLNWTTASERNMKNFEIQRSADGKNFSVIASEDCRNEFMRNEYSFDDLQPLSGNNYYRLKMNDENGHADYSNIIAIKTGSATNIDIVSVYPNPALNEARLSLYSAADGVAGTEIFDLSGKLVLSSRHVLYAGTNEITLNVEALAPGMYTVKVVLADGSSTVSRLSKQ